jgi:hypothetical protein
MVKKLNHDYQMVSMPPVKIGGELLSPNSTIRQRGLLESTPSFGLRASNTNSPFQFSTNTKQWRWWNYATTLLFLIICVELILWIISVILLAYASEPITFGKIE